MGNRLGTKRGGGGGGGHVGAAAGPNRVILLSRSRDPAEFKRRHYAQQLLLYHGGPDARPISILLRDLS
jgi:hypothetical protein